MAPPEDWTAAEISPWTYNHTQINPSPPISLIVGLENDVPLSVGQDWIHHYTNPLQIVQWTMASARNHSVVNDAIDHIVTMMKSMSRSEILNTDVTLLTGPGPWTDAVHRSWHRNGFEWELMRGFGSESKMMGDMLVLPTIGFA